MATWSCPARSKPQTIPPRSETPDQKRVMKSNAAGQPVLPTAQKYAFTTRHGCCRNRTTGSMPRCGSATCDLLSDGALSPTLWPSDCSNWFHEARLSHLGESEGLLRYLR